MNFIISKLLSNKNYYLKVKLNKIYFSVACDDFPILGYRKKETVIEFSKVNKMLGVQISNINLMGYIKVFYNSKDEIFTLQEAVSETEVLKESSRCGCCGGTRGELKNCEFCGQLVCKEHLNYERPYPFNNPNHENICTKVCLTCVSKLLYRDALFEMSSKLKPIHDEITRV